jgi:uncharacterized protein
VAGPSRGHAGTTALLVFAAALSLFPCGALGAPDQPPDPLVVAATTPARDWVAKAERLEKLLAAGSSDAGRSGVLVWAAFSDQVALARAALHAGADISAGSYDLYGGLYCTLIRPSGTVTALTVSARWGRVRMVQLLLQHGAARGRDRDSAGAALVAAASFGREEVVRVLLDSGVSPNGTDAYGFPAMGRAALMGNTRILSRLIRHGAAVDGVDADGGTPLMCAAEAGQREAVILLLERGAVRSRRDLQGRTAWDRARNALTWLRDNRGPVESIRRIGETVALLAD